MIDAGRLHDVTLLRNQTEGGWGQGATATG